MNASSVSVELLFPGPGSVTNRWGVYTNDKKDKMGLCCRCGKVTNGVAKHTQNWVILVAPRLKPANSKGPTKIEERLGCGL